ncbi:hypothetical protein FACS1894130_12240 [Spirochaetia bacterium]|nr:hypothetical protein FACS1894130_12240 [Spirochaetia bacterium]
MQSEHKGACHREQGYCQAGIRSGGSGIDRNGGALAPVGGEVLHFMIETLGSY